MTENDALIAVERHARTSPEFRARLMLSLSRLGLARIGRESMLYYRVRVARAMLDAGMSRAEAAYALKLRLGVSLPTARRLTRAALGKSPYKGSAT